MSGRGLSGGNPTVDSKNKTVEQAPKEINLPYEIMDAQDNIVRFLKERKENANGKLTPADETGLKMLEKALSHLYEIQTKYIETHSQESIEHNKLNADKENLRVKMQAENKDRDPLLLDTNETKAYELIKKTGILKDLEGFNAKMAAGDKIARADALQLEKALAADGKDLTADGVITQKTIDAARALISENAQPILKYEEVMNSIGAATATPAVPSSATLEK